MSEGGGEENSRVASRDARVASSNYPTPPHSTPRRHYSERYLPYDPTPKRVDNASVSADAHTYTSPDAVVMIVSGAPGDVERNDACPGDASLRDIVPTCTPHYGYGTFTVNATTFAWQFTAQPTPIGAPIGAGRTPFRVQAAYSDYLYIVKNAADV